MRNTINVFCFAQGNFGKWHKKAIGKAWKSGAEGESLKLLKESGAITFLLYHKLLAIADDDAFVVVIYALTREVVC